MVKLMPRSHARVSMRYVHIPTEILVQIANFVFDERTENDAPGPQSTLHDFCLVSTQWYSAGISFLYHSPQLSRGNSFSLFANTVCPPVRSKSRKVDLGSLVQVLDLTGLVHHSSNSLTARLLGRVKKSLKIFAAPRVSFSINSFAPLSKCRELNHLSLSLVADSFPLSDLKKTISHLDKLETLDLPPSIIITDDGSNCDWPPKLRWLRLGGIFDLNSMPTFRWPTRLEGLTLVDCEWVITVLDSISMNSHVCATLRELTVTPSHRGFLVDKPSVGVSNFISLRRLQIPIDELFGLGNHHVFNVFDLPSSIRELILTSPSDDAISEVDIENIVNALRGNLSSVCGVGISRDCLELLPKASRAYIDKLVWENIDNCPEEELDTLFDLGLYVR